MAPSPTPSRGGESSKVVVPIDYSRYVRRFGSAVECGTSYCKDLNYRWVRTVFSLTTQPSSFLQSAVVCDLPVPLFLFRFPSSHVHSDQNVCEHLMIVYNTMRLKRAAEVLWEDQWKRQNQVVVESAISQWLFTNTLSLNKQCMYWTLITEQSVYCSKYSWSASWNSILIRHFLSDSVIEAGHCPQPGESNLEIELSLFISRFYFF